MPLATGDRLGAYEILSPLGASGMGEVYRAADTNLKREVAIKVLPDALAGDRPSTRVERNECSGAFGVSGQTLTVGAALACTRAACPSPVFADAYMRVERRELRLAVGRLAHAVVVARVLQFVRYKRRTTTAE